MGLLTLKGKEVLEQADVVLYDKLSWNRYFKYDSGLCSKINVGKCAGNHTMPQAEINFTIVK